MTLMPFNPMREGRKPSASEMSRWFRELERQSIVSASPPLYIANQASGRHLRYDPEREFPARITDRSGRAYGWVEQLWQPNGTFMDAPLRRQGSVWVGPAYEVNRHTDVPIGSIVNMYLGFPNANSQGREYLFHWSCCPPFASSGSGSGSPSVTGSGSGTASGGPGGPVFVPCCKKPDGSTTGLPQTLYATLSNITTLGDDCSCWNGMVIPLHYTNQGDPSTNCWTNWNSATISVPCTAATACCNSLDIGNYLYIMLCCICDAGGNCSWTLSFDVFSPSCASLAFGGGAVQLNQFGDCPLTDPCCTVHVIATGLPLSSQCGGDVTITE